MNRWRWLPVALTVLGPGAVVALGVAWWSRLPEPVATHWGFSGRPDGHGPRWLLVLLPALIVSGTTAVAARGGRRGVRSVWFTGLGPTLGSIGLGVGVLALHANLEAETWRDAKNVSLAAFLGIIAAAALVGAGVRRAVRSSESVRSSAPRAAASAQLQANERAAFIGTTRARWTLWLLAPLIAVAVVAALAHAFVTAAITVASAALVANLTSVRVRADGHGVRVAFGPLGVPRTSIPLNDIVHARSIQDLEPMEWGGWGYRGSLAVMGRAAVVLRRGEALVLDLTRDRSFAVTIDHADQAAGLLNDLLRR